MTVLFGIQRSVQPRHLMIHFTATVYGEYILLFPVDSTLMKFNCNK